MTIRWIGRVSLVACVLLTFVALSGCSDDAKHRALLDSLVRNGANQQEVTAKLGSGVTVYERGFPSWNDLQRFLDREPAANFGPLREAAKKYPRILYYTTEWRMTWIFVDERGIARGYHLSSQ